MRYNRQVARSAIFDSSFWIHTVYLDLTKFLLQDFELVCTTAVEKELGDNNSASLRLKGLLSHGTIKRKDPKKETIKLYGDGERSAISLAIQEQMVLLIDDWRPYEAALEIGIKVVNSMVYIAHLYKQTNLSLSQVLEMLAKIARRGTIKPLWIESTLKTIMEIKSKKGGD